jgi:5-methylcytosine-specific restriction enzyme subunit McrC
MLVNICYLIVKGLIQIEKDGSMKLIALSDSTVMHALYERFLREYYRTEYKDIAVSAATIDWVLDEENREFLPTMNTDITLSKDNKKIIIDAKFYHQIMETNTLYGTSTYSSSNLYQIFSYVKNADPYRTGLVSGILLYGKFNNEDVKESDFLMSGNRISIKYIDLNEEWHKIKIKLDSIVLIF